MRKKVFKASKLKKEFRFILKEFGKTIPNYDVKK